jgi:hypothetical protein
MVDRPRVASDAVGVGHKPCRAIAPSVGRSAALALADWLNMLPLSTMHGVWNMTPGEDPDSLTKMRGAAVGC